MAVSFLYATVAGAGGKTGADWANAYDQTQIDAALSALSNQVLLIEADTYTTAALTYSATGTLANPVGLIAVNKSTHVDDGSRAIFDGQSSVGSMFTCTAPYAIMGNISVINCTSIGIIVTSGSVGGLIYNCLSQSNNSGWFLQTAVYYTIISCGAVSNTTTGYDNIGTCTMLGCYAYNNGTDGFEMYDIATLLRCISHNNTTGVECRRYDNILHCIIDGNTTGITSTLFGSMAAFFNKGTNNTTFLSASKPIHADWNFLFNNGTDYTWTGENSEYKTLNDVAMTAHFFEDLANDDFNSTNLDESVGIAWDKIDGTTIPYLSPMPYVYPTGATPTYAGLTHIEANSKGGFELAWTAGTNLTHYEIYISTSSLSWATSEICAAIPLGLDKTAIYKDASGNDLQHGTDYYVGVRGFNDGSRDSNTAELILGLKGSAGSFVVRQAPTGGPF